MLDIVINSSVPRNRSSVGVNATITLSHHTNTTSQCSMRTLVSLEAHYYHYIDVLGTYTLDANVRSPHNHCPHEISHEKYQLGIAVFSLVGTMQQSLGLSIHHSPFVQSGVYQLKRNLHQWIDEFHVHATARQRHDDERDLEAFVAFGERPATFEGYAHTQQQQQQQGYPTPSPTSTQATSQSDKRPTPSPPPTTASSTPSKSSAPVGPLVYTFRFTPPASPSLSLKDPSGLRSHDFTGHVILHRRPIVGDSGTILGGPRASQWSYGFFRANHHPGLNPADVADAQAEDVTDEEDEETKRTRWEDRKESGRRGVGQRSPFARGPERSDMNFETARVWAERQRREEEKAPEAALGTPERFCEENAAKERSRASCKSSNGEHGESDWSVKATTERTVKKAGHGSSPYSFFRSSVRSTLYDVYDS